jgi:polysaccharide biosynthesis protein PslH
MLFSPARLVSAPQGVAGVPKHVQACFKVATQPQAFADAVLAELAMGPERTPAEQDALTKARDEFGFDRAAEVMQIIHAAIKQQRA